MCAAAEGRADLPRCRECGCAERLIGSIRRDCLDHVIVFGEQHLRRLLKSYQEYYNDTRTHLSLGQTLAGGSALCSPKVLLSEALGLLPIAIKLDGLQPGLSPCSGLA